jgi:uncharacterized protein (DUF433 family)
MPASRTLVPLAEAAFIAGLNDRQMNRVVDEHLFPPGLMGPADNGRLFTRLSAAFARFYFGTEPTLVATARRDVVEELTTRVRRSRRARDLLALRAAPSDFDWKVARSAVEIDVSAFVAESWTRARQVEAAESVISEDPEILGGMPCFSGTRVPIEFVLASLDEGSTFEEVADAYPIITPDRIAAARVYLTVHPRRGRPRGVAKIPANWTRISRNVIRQA